MNSENDWSFNFSKICIMKKTILFNTVYRIALSGIILITASNCKKNETQTNPVPLAPAVSTLPARNINENSATIEGLLSTQGQSPVTDKGIAWGTSANPTIADNQTWEGSGVEEFTSTLPDLLPRTTYYARAYATNSFGTSYGNTVIFKTANPPPPGFMVIGETTTGNGETRVRFDFLSVDADVAINTITITNPLKETNVIQEGGMIWRQFEYHILPDLYIKYPGVWTFTFTGTLVKNEEGFSTTVTVSY